MSSGDRLFVPLKTEHYRNFEQGDKRWELRGVNDQYNCETVRLGRTVELRRGYSTGDSLWGEITARDTFRDLHSVEYYQQITPGKSKAEFLQSAEELLGQYEEYIAFRVALDASVRPASNGGESA